MSNNRIVDTILDAEILSDDETFDETFDNNRKNIDNSYNEVLELTQFQDKDLVLGDNSFGVIAEYKDINTSEVTLKYEKLSEKFVTNITKFVTKINDEELSENLLEYIETVGQIQINQLSDALYLVDINKQMLTNIISRINAVQAEDYALINTYNNLSIQHIKLLKEAQTIFKNIPTIMKRMKTEITCNQELGESLDITSETYGTTHFNNGRDMLRSILENNE